MNEFLLILKSQTPEGVKRRQKVVAIGGFLVFVTVITLVFVMKVKGASDAKNERDKSKKTKISQKIRIDSAASTVNNTEVWVDKLEREMGVLRKQNEEMKKVITEVGLNSMQRKMQASQTSSSAEMATAPGQISSQLNTLNLSAVQGQPNMMNPVPQKSQNETGNPEKEKAKEKAKIVKISFNLDPSMSKRIRRSVDHYAPAGTFVHGVLTSGVVASTSVQASSNPQPVHIQMTDLGNLPRGFKTDIKQCFLIGSAYGDLAAERVFMRLEKLSCVERKTGEIIELDVDGYVAGEDGANGLRGIVVDRSGPVMRNAFVGGFLSGVSDFFSQQHGMTPTSIGQGGVAMINPLSASQMAQAGAGKGVGNAMEKLSDFYVKRAEQLQPVIEIEPGRSVDIVFKAGFDMNQTLYRQSLKDRNDVNRRDVSARDFSSRDTSTRSHDESPQSQNGY